ncbi:ribosome small subunit-dependent GTPase A [Corynebacterium choanae]|uniref:Ribosome biogenesis GTPase RsgA n=1 Tax=Corynebacterium choanae TaxID=1862358 RepID=A0A3G6J595_9CORY|nr:ribosome small subunit-dependent GTPase A [Corynebacterium choanae]AZA12923.1 Putative ribosome biogenesis GTPase RsgA [Corynebacterium choanae]
MGRNIHQFDESDVRIRPGKRSRPRTKRRPNYDDAHQAMVVTKDRGRYGVVLDDATSPEDVVMCVRAQDLRRQSIVVGDRVGVVGDVSGAPGTLARIVTLQPRSTVLRRTADDNDAYERIVIANAEQLLIVCAITDPPPRTGFVERALVAAFVGGLEPVLVITKTDLADPQSFIDYFSALQVRAVTAGRDESLAALLPVITGRTSACIGHSGVGKSTLVNRLVPDAKRAVGAVSGVGKGRHTSTQSVALPLPDGGWIIDTPGIRSFGLAGVDADVVVQVFDDLREAAEHCPRGCTHLGPPSDPECAFDELTGASQQRVEAIRRILTVLRNTDDWEL